MVGFNHVVPRADAAGRAAVVETTTFAATAATLWWFGDRGPRMK